MSNKKERNKFKISWVDGFKEPQHPADPNFPKGVKLDISNNAAKVCEVSLPYPAKRCGHWFVECNKCWLKVAATTAGRADDPVSIRVSCKNVAPVLNPPKHLH